MKKASESMNPVLVAMVTIAVTGVLGWAGVTLAGTYAFGALGFLLIIGSVLAFIWVPLWLTSDNPGLTYFLTAVGMIVASLFLEI